ncbi:AraC family transcriptional regulator [Gemmiger sp.]|uniref:AraC family transcriptional regulator n=1 Tax=Gemmiger sp. TaxID=2049027 RepID=UPI002A7627BA|nr:AraC family transcriptional regulator [Gemmiger sp.]MDY2694950.1 AraC family transcriptional regulator [Gemmiger sp.]
MLTYNMDVEERSLWLRATPGAAVLTQPFYCTEAGHFYGRSRFATARTDKESYLLFYTVAGAGLIEQGVQQVELPAGSALLLNCRTPQSYCTAPGQQSWQHTWVHLDGAGVANLAETLLPQNRLTPVRVSAWEMQPLFDTIFAEWDRGTVAAQIETGLTLHRMLALMAARLLAGDASRSNRALIEQATGYIRAHYAEPLSLDALLAQTPVSKSWFLRLFRQYTGTTPYNFLLSTRITRAKELLVLTDFAVSEVAHQVGFGDESNFSTRFTAMVGQSPQQYRKSAMQPR